jgi:hypothetical protein
LVHQSGVLAPGSKDALLEMVGGDLPMKKHGELLPAHGLQSLPFGPSEALSETPL